MLRTARSNHQKCRLGRAARQTGDRACAAGNVCLGTGPDADSHTGRMKTVADGEIRSRGHGHALVAGMSDESVLVPRGGKAQPDVHTTRVRAEIEALKPLGDDPVAGLELAALPAQERARGTVRDPARGDL